MKLIAKILCIGALLTATTSIAKADPLNQISFAGNNVIDQASGSVHFTDANGSASGNAYTGVAVGVFTPFGGGAATFHDFNYLSTSVPFALITDVAAGISATFNVTDFTYSMNDFGLAIKGVGNYVVNNGTTISDGTFLFTTQNNGGNVTFSDTNSIAVTPEPNSLMLLGTGLVSAAGMLVRRRRVAVA